MRFAMRVTIPTDAGNKAISNGRLGEIMLAFAERWKPEAMYFALKDGKRSVMIFLNMDNTSQMPVIAEPFFMELNAEIETTPCMDMADLKKGLASLAASPK
jgi:hypothetical protein